MEMLQSLSPTDQSIGHHGQPIGRAHEAITLPFAAKLAAPITEPTMFRHPVLERAAISTITWFSAPTGYLLTDSLAATLAESGRPILWLRLGPEDRDPATFLISLIAAARRLCPGVGAATMEQMRHHPGPTSGWPRLFSELARDLAVSLPVSTALVLEHSHFLNHMHPTMDLLCIHLLPALPDSFTCILTTRDDLRHVGLLPQIVRCGVADLRLDAHSANEMVERAQANLPGNTIRRILGLADGRSVVVAGLCKASESLGPALVQQAIERASSLDDLLARIARAWLAAVDSDALKALALAARLEYSHPEIVAAALGRGTPPVGPWFQPLEHDWMRVRAFWQSPLRAVLRAAATPDALSLRRAAAYLEAHGATERAVSLYFEVGDVDGATQTITRASESLMSLGQWETLSDWIERLPAPSLRASPWLVYAGGEIAAARSDMDAALRAFALAASLFTADHEAEGACQSMLAESAIAAWRGDHAHARTRARAACAMAEAAGLAWHQGWATWHLGCLAAAAGELDDALAYFDRAVSAAELVGDPMMIELLRTAETLILRQRELIRQREFHRQAYFVAEQARREAAQRLRQMLSIPPNGLDDLLDSHGWSRMPLMLKLPAPPANEPLALSVGEDSFWSKLLGTVGFRRKPKAPTEAKAAEPQPQLDPVPPLNSLALAGAQLGANALMYADKVPTPAARGDAAAAELPATQLGEPAQRVAEQEPIGAEDGANARTSPSLAVHLLGPLRVTLNDHPVESWPSGRGRAVFKYLLSHRDRALPRDVLMDVFWTDAGPEAARNNLNVALHGLRQALRAADDVPVVIFQDGAYRLSPDLQVWVDVDEFERHVDAGKQLEATGQLNAAAAEYEVAIGLYQGDFMADDPYEEWPVLTRERLRVAYLDTLERLGQLYFSQGQYAACAALCQLMLSHDNCREDAHCRLMRCYSRQGQQHLALRQYQACVEALRAELDVEPARATTQLYNRIRQRERV